MSNAESATTSRTCPSNSTNIILTLSRTPEPLCIWINVHFDAYQHFGGVTRLLVPDNHKIGVIKNAKDEAVINKAYREMSEHCRIAILPTRPRTPKDKSSVEDSVVILYTWILVALRNHKFLLAELNEAIWDNLCDFNHKPFQKKEGGHAAVFE